MEWVDPRYAAAVELIAGLQAIAPQVEAKRRCRKCRGLRGQVLVDERGGRHTTPCCACGGTGVRRVRQ